MSTKAARRYAQALLELAEENEGAQRWGKDLERLSQICSNPDMQRLLKSAALPAERKQAALTSALTGMPKLVVNFAKLAVANRQADVLTHIGTQFAEMAAERAGIVTAQAFTAAPLSQEMAAKLGKALQAATGSRKVEVKGQIDPSVIGGVKLRIGDKLWDGSVQGQLDAMRAQLRRPAAASSGA